MALELLLCFLLHLSIIVSPGQYYESEIDAFYQDNQAEVDDLYGSPEESQIVQTYSPALEFIEILDDNILN